jgi:hypothetical protein
LLIASSIKAAKINGVPIEANELPGAVSPMKPGDEISASAGGFAAKI